MPNDYNTMDSFSLMSVENFSLSKILLSISPEIWWAIYFLFIIVFGILTIILIYHWGKYSFHSPLNIVVQTIYVIGIVVFMALAGSMLLIYIN